MSWDVDEKEFYETFAEIESERGTEEAKRWAWSALDWTQKELRKKEEEIKMSNTCSQCNGKCCRTDLGYNVTHFSAGSDYHSCDYCEDGTEMAHWTALRGFDKPPRVDAVSTSCHCGGDLAWILKGGGDSPERMIGCTCHTEVIIRPNKSGYEILWSRGAKE